MRVSFVSCTNNWSVQEKLCEEWQHCVGELFAPALSSKKIQQQQLPTRKNDKMKILLLRVHFILLSALDRAFTAAYFNISRRLKSFFHFNLSNEQGFEILLFRTSIIESRERATGNVSTIQVE